MYNSLEETTMRRTQIYLDEGQHEMLQSRARREGKSLAAIIRDILDAYLCGSRMPVAADPFRRVIGIGKGDGSAVAQNYEDYLYGEEK
jgi:plasmid stability protein